MKRTAVLIDGGFFFQRVLFFGRKYFRDSLLPNAEHLAQIIRKLVRLHIEDERSARRNSTVSITTTVRRPPIRYVSHSYHQATKRQDI